jgi:hypothetical protein
VFRAHQPATWRATRGSEYNRARRSLQRAPYVSRPPQAQQATLRSILDTAPEMLDEFLHLLVSDE